MHTEVLNNVPDTEVGNNVELDKATGATSVTVSANKDGTSDITAEFPDEEIESISSKPK